MKICFIALLVILFSYIRNNATADDFIVLDLASGQSASIGKDIDFSKDIFKTKKIVLRRIKAGNFDMGTAANEHVHDPRGIELRHHVTLTRDFYIGIYEITQGQYQKVMDKNPSKYKANGEKAPVEEVTWYDIRGGSWPNGEPDASSFIGKLREMFQLKIDLPTEAQWEYACRAGTTGSYYVDKIQDSLPFSGLDEIAWFDMNSHVDYESYILINSEKKTYPPDLKVGTHEVGLKRPNAWGLYDMSGNVWEWCLDKMDAYRTEDAIDPVGPTVGKFSEVSGVNRGGSFNYDGWMCRSACRMNAPTDFGSSQTGFRIVIIPAASQD